MVKDTMSRLGDIPFRNFVLSKGGVAHIYGESVCMNKQGASNVSKLKQWLEDRGIKQSWLAQKTGITQGWLSKIVNGATPNVYDAQKIAHALGTAVEELWPVEDEETGGSEK
jgi:DNA-binding XRE family transcriptional regulator